MNPVSHLFTFLIKYCESGFYAECPINIGYKNNLFIGQANFNMDFIVFVPFLFIFIGMVNAINLG